MLFRAARTSLEIQIAHVVRKPPWWGTWREMWKRTSTGSMPRIVDLVECVETVPSRSWPRSQRWDSTSTLVNREDMKRCGHQLTKSWNTVKVRSTGTSLLFQLQREHSLASNCTGPIFLPPRDDLVLTDPNDRSRYVNKDKRWEVFPFCFIPFCQGEVQRPTKTSRRNKRRNNANKMHKGQEMEQD